MHECTECNSNEENPYSTSLCKNHQIELQMSLLDYLENNENSLKVFRYDFEHVMSVDDNTGIMLAAKNINDAREKVKDMIRIIGRSGYKDIFSNKLLREVLPNEEWIVYIDDE